MTVIDTGPLDEGNLDESTAAEHIHGICLKTGPPRRVGVELEWLVRDVRDPALPVTAGRTAAAVSAFAAVLDNREHQGNQDNSGHPGNGDHRFTENNGVTGDNGITANNGITRDNRVPGDNRVPRGNRVPGDNGNNRASAGSRVSGDNGANGHNPDPGGGVNRPANGDSANGDSSTRDRAARDRAARDRAARDRAARDRAASTELPSSSHPGVLPSGALLTAEPGGQLEISSQPAESLAELVRATCTDLAALRAALAADGLELAGIGLDPVRPPRRVLDLPRYAAMEAFFDSGGPWGRQMMCGTASVQVCLDAGDDSDGPNGYRWRWRLLHAIGPVLVAAFANSPLRQGRPTGWVSSRQQVWTRMDPGRTRPPRLDDDPRSAWAAYALDAELMCVRGTDTGDWSAPPGLTLRDWVRGGWERRPTEGDLEYHLSTLFPPVRPRGHFELRMIDAQPGTDGWIVPLAVCWALLADARAGEAALAAVAPLWDGQPPGAGDGAGSKGLGLGPWLRAARVGPADPATGRASRECFAAAREAMDRAAVPAGITAAVDAFMDQYVSNDRCPADDLLEEAR